MKIFIFIRGMWDYYVVGTWLYFFPSKSQDKSGDGPTAAT